MAGRTPTHHLQAAAGWGLPSGRWMRAIKHPWDKGPLGTAGTKLSMTQLKQQEMNTSPTPQKPPTAPSLGTLKHRGFATSLAQGNESGVLPSVGLPLLQQLNPCSWKVSWKTLLDSQRPHR